MTERFPGCKLSNELFEGMKTQRPGRAVGSVLTGGASILGVILTLAFGYGVMGTSSTSDAGAEPAGETLYDESADFRTKGLISPTIDELKLDHASTPQLLETYLALQRSNDLEELESLDTSFDQIEKRESLNSDRKTMSHLFALHGETCLRRGDLEQAQLHFEESRRRWPENPWAVRGLKKAIERRLEEMTLQAGTWSPEEQLEIPKMIERIKSLEREFQRLRQRQISAWREGRGAHLGVLPFLASPGPDLATCLPWLQALAFGADNGDLHASPWPMGAHPKCGGDLDSAVEADFLRSTLRSVGSDTAIGDGDSADATRSPRRRALLLSSQGSASPVAGWPLPDPNHAIADDRDPTMHFGALQLTDVDHATMAHALADVGFTTADLPDRRQHLLRRLLAEVDASRAGDELIVYYSGHGFTDADGTSVLALNGGGRDGDTLDLVTVDEIEAVLSHHLGEVTVILDACRDDRPAVNIDVGDLESKRGPNAAVVMWATSPGAAAIESDLLQGSPFTVAVKDYLERAKRGAAEVSGDDCSQGCAVGGASAGFSIELQDLRMPLDIHGVSFESAGSGEFNLAFDGSIGDGDFSALWSAEIPASSLVTGVRWPASGLGSLAGDGEPTLDFVSEFARIAEQTRRLAMDLHGIEQTPEISRGTAMN